MKLNHFTLLLFSIFISMTALFAQKRANVEAKPEGGFTKKVSGTWDCGEFGTLILKQSGNKVTGTYDVNGGILSGNIVGNKLIATWTEEEADETGSVEFDLEIRRMTPDPTHLTGRYKNSNDKSWSTGWNCAK
jgi:hypothetical protein